MKKGGLGSWSGRLLDFVALFQCLGPSDVQVFMGCANVLS